MTAATKQSLPVLPHATTPAITTTVVHTPCIRMLSSLSPSPPPPPANPQKHNHTTSQSTNAGATGPVFKSLLFTVGSVVLQSSGGCQHGLENMIDHVCAWCCGCCCLQPHSPIHSHNEKHDAAKLMTTKTSCCTAADPSNRLPGSSISIIVGPSPCAAAAGGGAG
jgi:hypothetical protein